MTAPLMSARQRLIVATFPTVADADSFDQAVNDTRSVDLGRLVFDLDGEVTVLTHMEAAT